VAGGSGSLLLRKGLVVAQVTLSFLLLFGAGLFVRSLGNLKSTNTGFRDMENLVVFQLSPALSGYDNARAVNFYRDVLENVRAIPGVRSAGMGSMALLAGDEWDSTMSVEGHKSKDGEDMQAFMNAVSPGYFDVLGTPVQEGRDFDRRDVHDESRVAIVNASFAKHFFGKANPIGRHIGWGDGPGTKLNIEIVGVVGDTLYEGPREGVHRQVFIPAWGNNGAVYYVRAGTGSQAVFGGVRQAVKRLDSSMPVFGLKTLEGQLDETLLTDRLIALLSAGFGILATLLAAIGLYGVLAFVVSRRTKELGLRMALGAQSGTVIWLVMRDVLLLLAVGLAIGVPAAIGLGRLVTTQLYGVNANNPVIAGATLVLLGAVAALAGFIPAWRASRIDPIRALHYE